MVPLVTFLIGLAAIIAGKFVRRSVAGDVPLCAGCGYDLRVRSRASERCPECGAYLMRPGAFTKRIRRPIPGVRVGGCVIVVLSGLMAWSDYGALIVDRYTNTDRLLWHVEHDRGRDFMAAVDKVTTRIREQPARVDVAQRRRFVDLLMNARLEHSPWLNRWNSWLDNAILAGEIADPLRDRYLDHLADEIVKVWVQDREWREGRPLLIEVNGKDLRPNALWRFYHVLIQVRLDGEVLACPELPGGQILVPTSQDSTRWQAAALARPILTKELLQRKLAGPHTLQVDFSATIDGGTGISGNARKVVGRSYAFPVNLLEIGSTQPVPVKLN